MRMLQNQAIEIKEGRTYMIRKGSQELHQRFGENCKVTIVCFARQKFGDNFMYQGEEPVVRFYFNRWDEIPDYDGEVYFGKINSSDVLVNESEIEYEVSLPV